MAGPTRLELATSGVTGRRSNQLNYDPANGNFPTTGHFRRGHGGIALAGLPAEACRVNAQAKAGGRYRTRTCDSRRVKPVLYQLS